MSVTEAQRDVSDVNDKRAVSDGADEKSLEHVDSPVTGWGLEPTMRFTTG